MRTPRRLDEISAAWLTEGLREAGALDGGSVRSLDVAPIGIGHGFLSAVGRVELEYDRPAPNAPRSVVVKLEPDAGAMRDFGDELHAFEREIRFYREVAPSAPIRLARLYFATTDPPDYAMVMEDLSYARTGDQVAGLHAAQVRCAAGFMGTLQSRYWGEEALAPLSWMPESNGVGGDYDDQWPSFALHFGPSVDPAGLELGERLVGNVAWVESEMDARPRTLVHTDLRADNLMLGEEGTPEEVLILDWQLAIRGLGAFDVARIMGGSELPEERHGHQLDVLRTWYDAVTANEAIEYSWEEAQRDMRLGALSCLCYPVHFHSGILDATGRARRVVEILCRRLFDSAVEMDAGAVLP